MHLWRLCHTPHESSIARKEQSSFKSFCLPTPCSCIQLSKSLFFLHQYLCQLCMSTTCGNRPVFYYLWSAVMQVSCKESRTLCPLQSWAWSMVHILSPGDWGAQDSSQGRSYRTEKQIRCSWEEGASPPAALQQLLYGSVNTRGDWSLMMFSKIIPHLHLLKAHLIAHEEEENQTNP